MHGADPQITTTVLEGLDDVLRAHPGCNFSLDALLDAVGIARPADPSVDGMPHNISLNKYAELLELAAQKTGDDCFGLHFAQAFPPGATGIFGFIMLNAPDVRTMVRCVTRFAKLSIEALDVAFEEQDGMAEITWTFSPLLVASHKQLTEFMLALFIDRVSRLLGEKWLPAKMEFTYAEPNSAGEYEAIFGRNLHFGRPVNRLTAPLSSFKRSAPHADSRLFAMLRGIAEKELEALTSRHGVVDRLGSYILANVSLGGIDLEHAAAFLALTPRQLQTELQHRNTTVDKEVAVYRKGLATRYLRDTDLPMTEIALLLGYSELSAFTRVARSWFQKSPTETRAELRAAQRAAS